MGQTQNNKSLIIHVYLALRQNTVQYTVQKLNCTSIVTNGNASLSSKIDSKEPIV